MITGDQILCHLIGDYVIQSDWMANIKVKSWWPAAAHALTYTLVFLFITRSLPALAVILGTHYLIDRYRLARYVCWAKNFLSPNTKVTVVTEMTLSHVSFGPSGVATGGSGKKETRPEWWHPWSECTATGYHKGKPPWMSIWLMIIVDNTAHILINGLAVRFL